MTSSWPLYWSAPLAPTVDDPRSCASVGENAQVLLDFGRWTLGPREPQAGELAHQGTSRDAEDLSGPALVPPVLGQGALDSRALGQFLGGG